MINLSRRQLKPLEALEISGAPDGTAFVSVRDGLAREYARMEARGVNKFVVGGAPGAQTVWFEDGNGKVLETASFILECETELEESDGAYRRLLEQSHDTMMKWWYSGYAKTFRWKGKFYKFFVSWLRDHVHCLKGMRYFSPDLKPGIEIYSDSQREDGMVWDKAKEICNSALQNWRDVEFAKGDFIRPVEGNPTRRFARVPVENDVEFLFLEGIYYTWKATGDDEWMEGLLDNAVAAVNYSTSDIYRWSEKYKLLKRGYTIDSWDYQSVDDVKRSGSIMFVDPEKTEFNIFHGDNTGMAAGCGYLAEMLEHAGRENEAEKYRELARELRRRLEKVSWNGNFYTHMVPENPDAKRDLGDTETHKQISMSNAYALNRNIGEDKCRAIISRYQALREEMPESSPGEFYNIYPPFEKGFRHGKWDYMNGGVSTIVGGELAHGALEHGFEEYGADILRRIKGWGDMCGGHLHTCLKGKIPENTGQNFKFVDIRGEANTDLRSEGGKDAIGWLNEPGENDMCMFPTGRQSFHGIEFDVIDPENNGRRACIGLSSDEPYPGEISVSVGQKGGSIYFLHCTDASGLAGWYRVNYSDGTHVTKYVHKGGEVHGWFMPAPDNPNEGGNMAARQTTLRQAWNGPNRIYENVGVSLYGWNNPSPGKEIKEIVFTAAETGTKWIVLGITLSDTQVQLPASPVSYGIPDMWGAAALVYALIEGLGGVKDTGTAFSEALIAPRWAAAGVGDAKLTAVYPASGGYAAYKYESSEKRLRVLATSSAGKIRFELLVPAGAAVSAMSVNGRKQEFERFSKNFSDYIAANLKGPGVFDIYLNLE